MTKDEAINILEEVSLLDDSMYQYNQWYCEALNMAIESLKTEAIPVEWIKSHMITHSEVINGDYFEDEALELNMYVSDLIERWKAEQRKEDGD